MRTFNAHIAGLLMKDFRFSKDYRWGTTLAHRIVYALVDVQLANMIADI